MAVRERSIDLDGAGEAPGLPLPQVLATEARHARLLAETVRAIYVGCRREMTGDLDYGTRPMPQWDGGTDAFGRITAAIWPKVAQRLITLGADPVEYIRAQFWAKRDGRTVTPTYLLGPQAATRWEEYRDKARRDVKSQLLAECTSVQVAFVTLVSAAGWPADEAMTFALQDTIKVQAGPLCRYCLAVAAGLPEAAARHRERAVLQYVFQQRLYDEIWSDFVPESLRAAATELRARLALPCYTGKDLRDALTQTGSVP